MYHPSCWKNEDFAAEAAKKYCCYWKYLENDVADVAVEGSDIFLV